MKRRGNSTLRFFDRYVGIPLIALLGLFKKKRELPEKISSIGLLKMAAIGDTALLSGIVRDIQSHFPQARLIFFAGSSNAEMAKLIDGVEIVPFKKLRNHQLDLLIDCEPWPRISALLTLFSRARCTIGFRRAWQGRHFGYDLPIDHKNCHELDNFRRLLKPLGISTHLPPRVSVGDLSKKIQVVCHLSPGGSRAVLKRWPEPKWKELFVFLQDQGYRVVLTGGKGDIFDFPGVESMAGKLSLRQTAELLASSACVISVDTGIMHLAAVLGCKVIGLHGPTSPLRWGGVGTSVISITPEGEHTPCLSLGYESKCTKNRCMQSISVEQVKQAFLTVINDENHHSGGRERKSALADVTQPLSQTVS